MSFSPQLLAHFREPRNVGELPPPAVMVEMVNPACGDILRLWVRVEEGVVAIAQYKVRGCTASIAAGSAFTELLRGRTPEQVRALRAADIEAALGGLPAESKHAATLCFDAARALADRMC